MISCLRLSIAIAALLTGACGSEQATATPPTTPTARTLPLSKDETHTYSTSTVVEGLDHPWSIAFLPTGELLITERPGRLRILQDGVLRPLAILGVPNVYVASPTAGALRAVSQGGLLEVVVHPSFESTRLIYLSYSKPRPDSGEGTIAVARARLEGSQLVDLIEIFQARAWSSSVAHFGGKMTFDSKGHLYVALGDRFASPELATGNAHPAQQLSSHQGKIVRLNEDGQVPADNPFVDVPDALPEIWSYGHRNPQGLLVHPDTGELWETEHGPQGGDEINIIEPGVNYGWPIVGYPSHSPSWSTRCNSVDATWYALQVRVGRERQCASHLSMRGYDVFLPCRSESRQWSDRRKLLRLPLFPGYLFFRASANPCGQWVTAPGVIRVVGYGSEPIPVLSTELEAINQAIQAGLMIEPCEHVGKGQRVRVREGPLRDAEGVVLRIKNRHRLVLSVTALSRAVAVELDIAWIQPSL